MKEINGKIVYSAFRSGAVALIRQKDYLNAINVFPVPDGDTGTNLATTVRSILYSVEEEFRVDHMAAAIDEKAMSSARGNSGMILAQYFHGWAESLQGKEVVTPEEMIEGFKSAVPAAYSAVEQPQEGTILTLMRVLAEELEKYYHSGYRGAILLEEVGKHMKQALALTMTQLEPLRRNQVIDSGAAGFLAFVEGIAHYMTNPSHMDNDIGLEANKPFQSEEMIQGHEESEYRYCTEGIIEKVPTEGILEGVPSVADMHASLSKMGDSLIVLDRGDKARFHLHTNDPEAVFAEIGGRVVMQKVEDMKLQSSVVNHPRSKIAVLTDSIADLDPEWALTHQVHVIPVGIMEDDQAFLDRISYSANRVIERVKTEKSLPTSAVPSPTEIKARIDFLQSHYDGILALMVSKKMSGFYYQVKKMAAESFADFPIEVIDTRQNSAAQGLLVREAVKAVESGKSLAIVADWIRKKRFQSKIFVAIHDVKPMIQGGRLSVPVGKIFQTLGIKPIISINEKGEGTAFGMHLKFDASLRHLERLIKREAKEQKIRVQVSYSDDLKRAETFARKLSQIPNVRCESVTQISSIVTVSAGSGVIAVAYMKEGQVWNN
jgi:hypothetical protein